jgi:hypothetical protein
MFFGEKERNLVKQVNDELAERVIGQPIAYYPISLEESNFNETYGESQEKVSLPPVRVYAYVVVDNEQTNEKFGYEYQTKLTVNFHRRRLVEDQNLFVRVGDFVQYGDQYYEIVRTYNDTRYLFGQVEHKFQIAAECVRARHGVFRVMPSIDRAGVEAEQQDEPSSAPAPRPVPFPPVTATYITAKPESKLPNERVLTAGTGITIVDGGPNGPITVNSNAAAAQGPTGSVQLQAGAGTFNGTSALTFLTSSNRLGIGTDAPTHALTVVGGVSASAASFFANDVTIAGTLLGGSPLKISGGVEVVNQHGTPVGSIAPNGHGEMQISGTCVKTGDLSASLYVSASLYYGDGRYLTNITASATQVAEGPVGALQFRIDSPVSGDITGSANVLYDYTNRHLTVDAGLVHARTTVSSSHTASVSEYILAVTAVPASIELDATAFSEGQVLVVKDESGLASPVDTITLSPSGAQTVDGDVAAHIESPYGSVLVYSNGTNWFIY